MVPLRAETLSVRLRDLGVVSPQQLEQAKQELANTQERFSLILVRQGLLRDPEAGKRLAAQLGSLPQRLEARPTETPKAAQVADSFWHSHRLIPLREEDGKLLVVTDDPLSVFALDFFGSRCGCVLEAMLIREQDFADLLSAPPAPAPSAAGEAPRLPPPAASLPPAKPSPISAGGESPRAQPAGAVDDEPIIRLVDSMLAEAVRLRASDIHLEAGVAQLRVRYRVDGVLRDVNSPPKALHGPIVSRIKIMAGLNIAEKRLPQDGRLQLGVDLPAPPGGPATSSRLESPGVGGGVAADRQAGHRLLDVRVSTLPSSHGESMVMRLLDRSQPIRGLVAMGMPPDDEKRWDALIHRPHGMVLVTGPTGSGKTTTLYGALSLLNQPDRKLITIEDPVEYQLTGVNQVLVKASIGLTFAAGLRSMLRQAPDIIMVGEIRDQETAQVAVQAALTGHLVLSTLHTNDAPSAMTRLIDMGIAPFLIASTVQGVLAQRLVRRICLECRISDNATPEEQAFLGASEMIQVIRSNGCEKCHGCGFFGRIGLFEMLVVSDRIRELIVSKANTSLIRQAAMEEGMRTLKDDGGIKIREGLTTMSEVLRVVLDHD